MLDAFDVPFMQRALVAGLVLAVPLGLVGTWVVLRALAFFSHAVGVGTFPGVVVGLGVPAIGPFVGAAAAAGILTAAVVGLGARRMQSVTFDRHWSRPAGARPGLVDLALLVLVAATVVVALPVVGSLLVSGLLVLPAATARVLTADVFTMLPVAVVLCGTAIVVGLAVARELDAPPGSVICATAGLAFAVTVLADRLLKRRGSP